MFKEFVYTQNPEVNEPIMFIDNEIGTGIDADGKPRIDGNEFLKELMILDGMGKKNITVYINSPGGVVIDGMAIYEGIKRASTKVNTYCYGIAYSIAGVIFQGGNKRIMADQSSLMYHNPYEDGKEAVEMSETDKKMLKVLTEGIITMIVAKTGKTRDEVEAIMDKITFITPKEAMEMGFCDEINSGTGKLVNELNWKEKFLTANKILNRGNPKIVNKMAEFNAEKVCNLLRINKASTEDAVYDAVKEILDKKKSDDERYEKMKADLEKKKADCDDLQKKMDDLKKEMADKVAADKAKSDADMDDKADEKLKNAIAAGKIKNDADTMVQWKKLFKVDFAIAEKTLDSLPATKKGASFVQGKEVEASHEKAKFDSDEQYKEGARKMGLTPGSAPWYNHIATEKAKAVGRKL